MLRYWIEGHGSALGKDCCYLLCVIATPISLKAQRNGRHLEGSQSNGRVVDTLHGAAEAVNMISTRAPHFQVHSLVGKADCRGLLLVHRLSAFMFLFPCPGTADDCAALQMPLRRLLRSRGKRTRLCHHSRFVKTQQPSHVTRRPADSSLVRPLIGYKQSTRSLLGALTVCSHSR